MSAFLVAAQFILIAAIGLPFARPVFDARFALGAAIFATGLALFAWAFAAMPRQSFTIMPEPRAGNLLTTRGPYALIRHPMYTSVLVCGAGAALAYGEPLKWFALAALSIVLWVKLRREEAFLLRAHAGYAEYRARSKALLPWIV
jgi:protein-S-isoprenylcysteine O-methyltransferase Ste14